MPRERRHRTEAPPARPRTRTGPGRYRGPALPAAPFAPGAERQGPCYPPGVFRFLTDRALYDTVILDAVPSAATFVWLATADLKDLHVVHGRRAEPFLGVLAALLERDVAVRLLHAKEPGPRFREDFDRYPVLTDRLERMLCPRVHFKSVIVDGRWVYSGSANLTGAGLGARSPARRNFESGFVTDEPDLVAAVRDRFDRVWMGAACDGCGRTAHCAEGPAAE